MFLFALPAAALADIVNKRSFILVLELLIACIAGCLRSWSPPVG
jgi:hypothetical protein